MSNEFTIGQKVVFKDIKGRKTANPYIADVICTICASENPHNLDFPYWINNPLRGYNHGVAETSIKDYLEPIGAKFIKDKRHIDISCYAITYNDIKHMILPHDLDEHIDHIDAAIFTGDTFISDLGRIERLQEIIQRWNRQLELNIIAIKEEEEENEL